MISFYFYSEISIFCLLIIDSLTLNQQFIINGVLILLIKISLRSTKGWYIGNKYCRAASVTSFNDLRYWWGNFLIIFWRSTYLEYTVKIVAKMVEKWVSYAWFFAGRNPYKNASFLQFGLLWLHLKSCFLSMLYSTPCYSPLFLHWRRPT